MSGRFPSGTACLPEKQLNVPARSANAVISSACEPDLDPMLARSLPRAGVRVAPATTPNVRQLLHAGCTEPARRLTPQGARPRPLVEALAAVESPEWTRRSSP